MFKKTHILGDQFKMFKKIRQWVYLLYGAIYPKKFFQRGAIIVG
jgi:hypothetical protein